MTCADFATYYRAGARRAPATISELIAILRHYFSCPDCEQLARESIDSFLKSASAQERSAYARNVIACNVAAARALAYDPEVGYSESAVVMPPGRARW